MSAQPKIAVHLSLTDLARELADAKALENAARNARLNVESAILAHPDVVGALKEEGTTTIGDCVKVSTGYSRAWDQQKLRDIEKSVAPEFFPFRVEFAEDRRASRVIEERFPELYDMLRAALTIKPKKPSVALVGE